MKYKALIANIYLLLISVLHLNASAALADEHLATYKGPIIDAHVHYSEPAWNFYPPKAVMEKFDEAGIGQVLVSSTPDEGTLSLHRHSPERVIKFLRPYRTRADMGNWFAESDVLAYVKQRLERNSYRGFGEFHMFDPAGVSTPEMKTLLKLAAEKGLILHSHSGPDVVEALAKAAPDLTILWAHAGMSSPPAVIGDIFSRYPQVYADMSFRGDEVLEQGEVSSEWMDLFQRFPDRLMIGSDTYINEQWSAYKQLIDLHRRWLGKLPPRLADAIAHGNARRMLTR